MLKAVTVVIPWREELRRPAALLPPSRPCADGPIETLRAQIRPTNARIELRVRRPIKMLRATIRPMNVTTELQRPKDTLRAESRLINGRVETLRAQIRPISVGSIEHDQ